MPAIRGPRLTTLRATIGLLYRTHPRAFVVSAVASLAEPLFFPAFILLLQRLLLQITTGGAMQITPSVVQLGIALLALLLLQRLGIIVRDASSTILYPLFENNAFQARYGLVIREAAQRSITLVDSLLSTTPIFFGLLGLAITLFTIAPLMVLAMVLIAIPAGFIERRFSNAMYALQEHTAPNQLRMEALTNMQVDAPWQRDVRVYHSNLIAREHAALADAYLAQLKQLTRRFLGLRSGAAFIQVLGFGLALTAAGALIARGQISLASLAVLIPGMALLSGMLGSLIYHYRELLESLNYAATLFEFLTTEAFDGHRAVLPAPDATLTRAGLAAIHLRDVSFTYPETGTTALTDISCTFRPGLTAIVGTNGVGKSTLVKLLAGLITPSAGAIAAIGPAGTIQPLDAYAKAVLFQDPAHFHFSIRHNVTMQFERSAGDEERIAAALRQAGLWDLVQALPDGIDMVVGAGFGGATDLSGGQCERQIFELLRTMAHEKLILFTTHRYDTIRKADTIVVLVDGHIAEIGTHEELERNAGDFWSLFLAQGTHPPDSAMDAAIS